MLAAYPAHRWTWRCTAGAASSSDLLCHRSTAQCQLANAECQTEREICLAGLPECHRSPAFRHSKRLEGHATVASHQAEPSECHSEHLPTTRFPSAHQPLTRSVVFSSRGMPFHALGVARRDLGMARKAPRMPFAAVGVTCTTSESAPPPRRVPHRRTGMPFAHVEMPNELPALARARIAHANLYSFRTNQRHGSPSVHLRAWNMTRARSAPAT